MPDPKSLRQRVESTTQSRERAKQLRRELTPPEKILWAAIKSKKFNNLHFRTQHPLGPYIADFYCHAARFVIEVDGNAHQGDQLKHDQHRDQWLKSQGLNILRIHACEVFENLEGVMKTIARFADECMKSRDEEREQEKK